MEEAAALIQANVRGFTERRPFMWEGMYNIRCRPKPYQDFDGNYDAQMERSLRCLGCGTSPYVAHSVLITTELRNQEREADGGQNPGLSTCIPGGGNTQAVRFSSDFALIPSY